MRSASMLVTAAVSASLASSVSLGQAVEWRVADGGNGHWYQIVTTDQPMTWFAGIDIAAQLGGYAATITTDAESEFVLALSIATGGAWSGSAGPWIGAWQDTESPRYWEPGGAWRWVTDEPWGFAPWAPFQPNNGCPGWTGESVIHLADPNCEGVPSGAWTDRYPWGVFCPPCGDEPRAVVLEFDADCNGDGIVDIAQIQAGALGDNNGNGVPDCCETPDPVTCAGDLNGDGVVNGADLSILLGLWGTPSVPMPPGLDIDCDGKVTAADLAGLLGAWGPCGG